MSMISNEVLRITPNREKVVIRTTWGDTEVDIFALAELAIWKAENKCVVSDEERKDLLAMLDTIKEKVTV